MNAQAVEGTAANYKQAATAVNEHLAAEGGGTNPLPSGGQEQLQQEVANSAAANESNQETQIQEANYAEGARQYGAAASGLEGIATGTDPLGYENAATASGSAAANTANQIAQEDNSWVNAAIGAAGTIAGAALSGKR